MSRDYEGERRGWLDHDLVDGPLDRLKLTLELTVLGGGDARGNDGSRDVASTSQGCLGFNKDIRNVLLFAKQGKMQEDFKRLCVSGEDDKFCDTAVQGFRSLVSTLFELLVLSGLIDELQNLVVQLW